MTVNPQQVFEQTVHLMGEAAPVTGLADCADTRDYKNRTLAILNILLPQCASGALDGEGARPDVPYLTDFDTAIDMDERVCRTLLPYGLAAHLLAEENPTLADFYLRRYDELLARHRRSLPVSAEGITDCYGGAV